MRAVWDRSLGAAANHWSEDARSEACPAGASAPRRRHATEPGPALVTPHRPCPGLRPKSDWAAWLPMSAYRVAQSRIRAVRSPIRGRCYRNRQGAENLGSRGPKVNGREKQRYPPFCAPIRNENPSFPRRIATDYRTSTLKVKSEETDNSLPYQMVGRRSEPDVAAERPTPRRASGPFQKSDAPC